MLAMSLTIGMLGNQFASKQLHNRWLWAHSTQSSRFDHYPIATRQQVTGNSHQNGSQLVDWSTVRSIYRLALKLFISIRLAQKSIWSSAHVENSLFNSVQAAAQVNSARLDSVI